MTDKRNTVNAASVVTLNSVGLSLKGIAERLGCHHTTVSQKLKELNIPPSDTRRAFMEDVWESLSPDQRKHLVGRVGTGRDIKDFVKSLIVADYLSAKG